MSNDAMKHDDIKKEKKSKKTKKDKMKKDEMKKDDNMKHDDGMKQNELSAHRAVQANGVVKEWVASSSQPTLVVGQNAAIPLRPADAASHAVSPRVVKLPSVLMANMPTVPVPEFNV